MWDEKQNDETLCGVGVRRIFQVQMAGEIVDVYTSNRASLVAVGQQVMHGEHDHLRSRLLASVNLDPIGDKAESHQDLVKSEWSAEFEQLMRNRLVMGRFRYGRMDRTDQRNYDRVGSAIRRLKHYQATGNLEFLVDAANLCLMEFEHSEHPDKHFDAADDGEHVSET